MVVFLRCRVGILFLVAIVFPFAWVSAQSPVEIPPEDAAPVRPRVDYAGLVREQRAKLGKITIADFVKRYPPATDYVAELPYDPTTAKYFDQFQTADPQGRFVRRKEFRLNDTERELFRRNGFVVSGRMAEKSFAKIYFEIYSRDLPVIVTTDSILHAWHRSYDAALVELEKTYLIPTLRELLDGMSAEIPRVALEHPQSTVVAGAIGDADLFLAVARSLLDGKTADRRIATNSPELQRMLTAIANLQMQEVTFAGAKRRLDFSQFKPRGHYEKEEVLRRYFQAMMWLGRTDFQFSADKIDEAKQQIAVTAVLHELLKRSGKWERWQEFDRVMGPFVGQTDAANFADIGKLLATAKFDSLAQLEDADRHKNLARLACEMSAGQQRIRSEVSASGLSPAFAVLGQRFTVDSWATGQFVYDQVLNPPSDEPVMRRIPSAIDVAFGVFKNNHVVPELARRMEDRQGRRFRDGLPFHHNLAAVREMFDQLPETGPTSPWGENLYTDWLACLRELSRPMTEKHPTVFRTKAWGMKTTNTQLASWTQLRHDSILYVKQTYTRESDCVFPARYVEPYPEFFARMEQMASHANEILGQLVIKKDGAAYPRISPRLRQHFSTFASRMRTLNEIATRQLEGKELTDEQTLFMRNIVTKNEHGKPDLKSGGRDVRPAFEGWYFDLFYPKRDDADERDALVADVHSDPPDFNSGDPGCVLHQGVGDVDVMLIAIDHGSEKVVYAGPTLSHYEFEMPGLNRRSDSEWKQQLDSGPQPRPGWTRSYLAP